MYLRNAERFQMILITLIKSCVKHTVSGIVAASLLGLPVSLNAQSTFGSIRGITQDQTGALLPQALVTLHNVDENSDATMSSDASGNYVFENIRPGHYRVSATKEGFAKAVVDKVELAARQDIRLELKLALATATQQVEVQAGAVVVNTENATLTDSEVNTDITQLPINSRAVSTALWRPLRFPPR